MRWMRGLVVAAVSFAVVSSGGSASRADQGGEDAPGLAGAEQAATGQIRDLRTAARKLKRLSSEIEKSGGPGDYATWLRESGKRVDALAKRWATGIDLYHREFPPESLVAEDPERASTAARWIGQKNAEFRNQVLALQQDLLAANAGFGNAPRHLVGRARAIFAGMSG